MLGTILTQVQSRLARVLPWALPGITEETIDRTHPTPPSNALTVRLALEWLCRAQDLSSTQDGGVARHYSLEHGWGPSYPETTGYIVPTFFDHAEIQSDERFRRRARIMLDWLLSIQFPNGAFPGGTIVAKPSLPVVFNTGQILLGLARGAKEFGSPYCKPMHQAARWLVAVQEADGSWKKFRSPFASQGAKTYETHVAWGLIEAARVEPEAGFGEAAIKNVLWAISRQRENGWLPGCCLDDDMHPLTHTVGYALRGVLEAYGYWRNRTLLCAALRTADGLLSAQRPDGALPGRLDQHWRAGASWSCLTGNAQIAICWLMLYWWTGEKKYREAAHAANRFVRRHVSTLAQRKSVEL